MSRTSKEIYAALTPEQKVARIEATRRWRERNKKIRRPGIAKGTLEWRRRQQRITALWNARNPEKLFANANKYRASKSAAACDCCQTPDAKANFVLAYGLARRLRMEVDHVRPLAKSGKHCLHNLQLLTQHDNRTKSARFLEAA